MLTAAGHQVLLPLYSRRQTDFSGRDVYGSVTAALRAPHAELTRYRLVYENEWTSHLGEDNAVETGARPPRRRPCRWEDLPTPPRGSVLAVTRAFGIVSVGIQRESGHMVAHVMATFTPPQRPVPG